MPNEPSNSPTTMALRLPGVAWSRRPVLLAMSMLRSHHQLVPWSLRITSINHHYHCYALYGARVEQSNIAFPFLVHRQSVALYGTVRNGDGTNTNAATPQSSPRSRPSLLRKITDGAIHYWNGTKLLALETRVSFGILKKVLSGQQLIRREYRQLLRTSSDMVRLIPFIIILIVPFLEFALPVLLKFFPNMLPSTFEDKLQAEEKVQKQLKIKLETAKFLQDMAENLQAQEGNDLGQLNKLFAEARKSGRSLSVEDILQASKHLEAAVKLENLTRSELLSLCRYMGLTAFGTDNYLRYQIRNAIRKLKLDDQMIAKEGVETLTIDELKAACHARGIRSMGTSEKYMRAELQQWIDLQLKHSMPAALMILSRALALSDSVPLREGLKEAVENISSTVASTTASEAELSPVEKIRVIKEQEALIKEDLQRSTAMPDQSFSTVQEEGGEEMKRSKETTSDLSSISEAVATLTGNSGTSDEQKKVLAELKEELSTLKGEASANEKVRALEKQVGKLISDIEKDLIHFEAEISKRLQILHPDKDGTITIEQLQSLLSYIKNTPKDAARLQKIIEAFDRDGDGKVFLRDIKEMAQQGKSSSSTSSNS